jgi:hypothetical protein
MANEIAPEGGGDRHTPMAGGDRHAPMAGERCRPDHAVFLVPRALDPGDAGREVVVPRALGPGDAGREVGILRAKRRSWTGLRPAWNPVEGWSPGSAWPGFGESTESCANLWPRPALVYVETSRQDGLWGSPVTAPRVGEVPGAPRGGSRSEPVCPAGLSGCAGVEVQSSSDSMPRQAPTAFVLAGPLRRTWGEWSDAR